MLFTDNEKLSAEKGITIFTAPMIKSSELCKMIDLTDDDLEILMENAGLSEYDGVAFRVWLNLAYYDADDHSPDAFIARELSRKFNITHKDYQYIWVEVEG